MPRSSGGALLAFYDQVLNATRAGPLLPFSVGGGDSLNPGLGQVAAAGESGREGP